MSEAPRVELNTGLIDLDPTVPLNQYQQSNGSSGQNLQNSAIKTKDSFVETAQHAMSAANNHPAVQNAKDTVLNGEVSTADFHNRRLEQELIVVSRHRCPKCQHTPHMLNFTGPVAQNVKAEGAKTRDEFADLANARTVPDQKTATGQNLTHYHSLFYRLLSWKNPRATGIAFASTIVFIFAARYLNIIRYLFKAVYVTLGATATAEVAGQLAFGRGLTSQFRPRQYFTIPKASLERLTDDLEQFINFFVIESQRIVFAENVYVTIAAFFASLISYFLIKFVPLWGLGLIATLVTYLGPLIYIKNKEVIDAQIEKGYSIANQQARQVKELANQHAGNAVKTVQGYTQQATAKAQETVNQYRGRSTSPEVKKEKFPAAPTHDLPVQSSDEEEVVAAKAATPVKPVAQPAL